MKVADDTGKRLDAEVSLEQGSGEFRLVFESRGPDRNVDYIPAFAAVIRRLSKLSAVLTDAVVDSKNSARLGHAERRMLVDSRPFPISLSRDEDSNALAIALRSAAAKVGRQDRSSGGGNPTKRVALSFALPGAEGVSLGWLEEKVVSPNSALELAAIERVARPRKSRSGQGRGLDAAARKAVETRAMEVARSALCERWAEVLDVSATQSFDFHCKSHQEEQLVEVKGSTGDGSSIILTANEAKLAKDKHPHVALYLVTTIQLQVTATGVSASGGELTIYDPFDLTHHSLEPVAFQCFLGQHKQ
jgi:hypothetical protein